MRDIIDRIEASYGGDGGGPNSKVERVGDYRRDAINEIRRMRGILDRLRGILCKGGDERALQAALWREAEQSLLGGDGQNVATHQP